LRDAVRSVSDWSSHRLTFPMSQVCEHITFDFTSVDHIPSSTSHFPDHIIFFTSQVCRHFTYDFTSVDHIISVISPFGDRITFLISQVGDHIICEFTFSSLPHVHGSSVVAFGDVVATQPLQPVHLILPPFESVFISSIGCPFFSTEEHWLPRTFFNLDIRATFAQV
jgi:hypothetical protein